ncbi:MAG: hypothetical protein O7C65_07070 [Planctomycetota bacterium]|nr:hypothetical protein [Planctomycetota bacterium]
MKSGIMLTVAGLAGIAVLVGQMYAGARPGRGAAPVEYDYATAGGIAGGGAADVAVCDMPNWVKHGVVGSITAYSFGTTSVNVGTVNLNWIDGSPNHPVISQNMFRLKDGKFEHIGQSWLKHGFCALQLTGCGACAAQGGCLSFLKPGCRDPYSAGLNGSQGGLGPKFEVNAATGVFLWPYTADGVGGNTIYKRLQVATADLANPGALYFIEGQYIAPDDAAAGNDNNNASYRRVNISGSHNLSFVGVTQQQDPAIQAWQDQDPSVSLVIIDVANDGRFILGYKATDLGGGIWHYEYALQNLNSDRSGQSFSVSIPACVTVTNEGFHDVFYHSGEPYDGTDWPVTVGGGEVSWSTDDFTSDPNANALRWGTMYNYRFDADSPPTPVTVEIGLFKTAPASVTVDDVLGPAGPTLSPDITGPLSVPDGCVDAFDLGAMLAAWCSAVNDPNPPSPPCENCNPASLCLVDISGADMVPDGCVDAFDLAKLLAAWCSVAGGNPCNTCFPPP